METFLARLESPAGEGGPGMSRLRLFQGFGVELEYMVVDAETLSVLPVVDRVLEAVAGEIVSEVERGALAWSNELVLHVVELKTNGPAPTLRGLDALFQADVRRINGILEGMGAILLPTAMHPWMDPLTRNQALAPRVQPHLRELRPHLRLPGTRVVQPPEHPPQPPLRGRRGVRPSSRRHPTPPPPPSGSGRQLPLVEGAPPASWTTAWSSTGTTPGESHRVTGEVIPEPVFRQAEYERRSSDGCTGTSPLSIPRGSSRTSS